MADAPRPPAPVPTHALKRTRDLRRDMTDAERRLWHALRGRRFEGVKFTRQYAIGPYVVDFVCRGARLIIEIDGDQHGRDEGVAADDARTMVLEQNGYRVIRFWNAEVLKNLDGVLQVLGEALRETPRP
ncbi:endonuclease domain-containing protein [Vineibacter terrae]|uniref:Endonuclease domain-containing protein n=1 Tax=Vineibacter terrae TaxID=2586908 RepID=A0A5C8P6Q5_9HYPH|nr:endonuclease domain-containing protein [Vineibacter terrae]TXL69435.1 endonuclease domain-containing protein [Vineibacter terrae]